MLKNTLLAPKFLSLCGNSLSVSRLLGRCAFVRGCKITLLHCRKSLIIPLHRCVLTGACSVWLGIKCFLNWRLSREPCNADSQPGARIHTSLRAEWQMVLLNEKKKKTHLHTFLWTRNIVSEHIFNHTNTPRYNPAGGWLSGSSLVFSLLLLFRSDVAPRRRQVCYEQRFISCRKKDGWLCAQEHSIKAVSQHSPSYEPTNRMRWNYREGWGGGVPLGTILRVVLSQTLSLIINNKKDSIIRPTNGTSGWADGK